jgi:tetratricopeptide (TPR) repeat protein
LNQPLANVPAPGEMMTRGSLNPQQAAQQAGVLTGSSLYGVREWNPQDPADRAFLENLVNRQTGGFNRAQLDPNEVLRMRAELQKALGAEQSQPGGTRVQDNLTLSPIGQTFESSKSPLMSNRPLNDQISNQALGASGMSTEQGMRFNVEGNARRTSTQYTELNKRLEQYYADRRKTDADFARDFNADLKAKREAEAKAVANKTKPLPGTADNVTPPKPDKPPTPDTDKPKVKKPQPVKITSLGEGVRGEGLGNVMKRAEALMKEGKFASAMDQYDAADAVTPNNPLIWLGRANAELGSGFFARADAHLHQAFTTDKALLMAQYDLTGMLGEERLGKLVAELKDIANKDATKPMPLFLLAYIAYNTGHERQALGYLDLAEKRAGDQAPFYKMLRDHWALPEEGGPKPDAGVTTPKPELNKPELNK